jgi:hypothetical protein
MSLLQAFFSRLGALVWMSCLCLAGQIEVEDSGRAVIWSLLARESLSKATLAAANQEPMRSTLRSDLLGDAPGAPKAIDAFLGEIPKVLQVVSLQDGKRTEVTVAMGALSARSRAFLLSLGTPPDFVGKEYAIVTVKENGARLAGDALEVFRDDLLKHIVKVDGRKRNYSFLHEQLLDTVFDKGVRKASLFGPHSPEWAEQVAQVEALRPNNRSKQLNVGRSITHILRCEGEEQGMTLEIVAVAGRFDAKSRDCFYVMGVPSGLVDEEAAVVSLSLGGKRLQGDVLEDLAQKFKAYADKSQVVVTQPKAAPPVAPAPLPSQSHTPADIELFCRMHGLEYHALATDSHLLRRANDQQQERLEQMGVKIYRAKIYRKLETFAIVSIIEAKQVFSESQAREVLSILEPNSPTSVQERFIYCYMGRPDPKSSSDEPIYMKFEDFLSWLAR